MEKETFYTDNRQVWRNWLLENYKTKDEIWFVFPTKASNEPGLSYNDAVEEALCFGWIDSTAGKLDDNHGLRRFTKRTDESYYSRPNIERLIWLNEHNLLLDEIKEKVKPFISSPYIFPQDILDEINKDKIVARNFNSFTDSYKRIRIAYIDAARKRPEEFNKRLGSFIKKTRENKLIVGFGGIDKYYK